MRSACPANARLWARAGRGQEREHEPGDHPRYELIATGEIYDGEAEVRRYFAETRAAFPDQRNELIALHHADDAVVAEFDLLGTHLGPLLAVILLVRPSLRGLGRLLTRRPVFRDYSALQDG